MDWEKIFKEMSWSKVVATTIKSVVVIIAILILLSVIPRIFVEYWTLQSLGYPQKIIIDLSAEIPIFMAIFVVSSIIFLLVGKSIKKQILGKREEADKRIKKVEELNIRTEKEELDKKKKAKMFQLIYNPVMIFVSLIFAKEVSNLLWFSVLEYLNQVPFGISDPIFDNDLAFYFFTLPLISKALCSVLVLGIILAIVSFARHLIAADGYFNDLKANPLDWRIIWTAIAFILAGLVWFGRYSILYNKSGIVYGAGYIDVHIWKVFWPIFAVILLITGVVCLLSKKSVKILGFRLKLFKQPVLIVAVIVIALIMASISGFVMWKTDVKMNEQNKELPYIINHTEFTRYGFDIGDIHIEAYPGTASLNTSMLELAEVNNIRIVDYRAVEETLKKNQEIRTYYEFFDIDIDRYYLNGNKTQVLVVPREMNLRELPEKAQTWVNKKLIYTHGYGVVICPVNQVTKIGEPELLVKDIPSRSMIPGFNITQLRIYYGEGMNMNDYIITNTKQEEFDYPVTSEKSNQESNVYCQYSGSGGVVFDTSFKKIIAAMNCDFLNIMLSDDITKDSRLHIYRNIIGRIDWICPYLYWDNDALYFFDKEGKGKWMAMGMPVSKKLPYSMPIGIDNAITINYARDSVKAVVSPLNGDIDFYVTDWDPMMRTYANIYPGIFKDISEMPKDVKTHLKVSEQLCDCRIKTANTYHMAPNEFYHKEDVWAVADEIYRGGQRKVESYNVLLPLSGEEEVQFILQSPQTPRNKKILIAWYGVNQDPEHYNEITLYKLPKGSSVPGPLMVEGKISEDTVISQAMTYWGGKGSRVIEGNLITEPIGGAFLNIEPIYIESEHKGASIPQLKMVAVYYKDYALERETVGLGITLDDAMRRAIAGETVSFETLQKEREVVSVGGLTNFTTAVMKVEILDESGNIVETIEVLQGGKVISRIL